MRIGFDLSGDAPRDDDGRAADCLLPHRRVRQSRFASDPGLLDRLRDARDRLTPRAKAAFLPKLEAGMDRHELTAALADEILQVVRMNPAIVLDPGWWQAWPDDARATMWRAARFSETTFTLHSAPLRRAALDRMVAVIEEAAVRTQEMREVMAAVHLVLHEERR